MSEKSRRVKFGDFQTPPDLARQVAEAVAGAGFQPNSILEPTCGQGSMLSAALDQFPSARVAIGFDINPEYVRATSRVRIAQQDFFTADWPSILDTLPDPLLLIGNPPWVTNSVLGQLGGGNLPAKSNSRKFAGLDALTGKSNFDISEWMLSRLSEYLHGRDALMAMLCKTAVARKVLLDGWRRGLSPAEAAIFPIDSKAHFGASVDACLLMTRFPRCARSTDCLVFDASWKASGVRIGYRNEELVADTTTYETTRHLQGPTRFHWRSGVKHDCASVMELRRDSKRFVNGLGERIDLEEDHVYPLYKSSQLNGEIARTPDRWMIVPQRKVGESTAEIETRAPLTWKYLKRHRSQLEARASRIYKGRAAFAIFGIGPYSFAPWKVAISGLYKRLRFTVVPPLAGRPAMLDDTAYFLPCESEREALELRDLLHSGPAQAFFRARVFWDAKRPITASLLGQLSIERLAEFLKTAACNPLSAAAFAAAQPS